MSLQQYIDEKKDIYTCFLNFLDNSSDDDENEFRVIEEKINNDKYAEDPDEICQILYIIQSIASHHHNGNNFIEKIKKIILYLKDRIKKDLSDIKIFYMFMNNKAIIKFLLESEIISFSKELFKAMTSEVSPNGTKYWHFFNTEMKSFVDNSKKPEKRLDFLLKDPKILENFEEKRKEGQNDSYICGLIRKDSVEEFISYVNKVNYPLNSEIEPSIFETNLFLNENRPTLIEYAAFFGSIQIFQYLRMNKVSLTPSLWLYAIHSQNAELIHLLESDKVAPPNDDYLCCFIESIKCHHNDIANYIENNLLPNDQDKLKEEVFSNILHYYNYEYFPSNLDEKLIFYHLCSNDYHKIVKILLESKEKEFNEKIIFF